MTFVLIVVGAFFFANAREWAGVRLGAAQGAAGSLLALDENRRDQDEQIKSESRPASATILRPTAR